MHILQILHRRMNGRETPFVAKLIWPGLERWSNRLSMGPLPAQQHLAHEAFTAPDHKAQREACDSALQIHLKRLKCYPTDATLDKTRKDKTNEKASRSLRRHIERLCSHRQPGHFEQHICKMAAACSINHQLGWLCSSIPWVLDNGITSCRGALSCSHRKSYTL